MTMSVMMMMNMMINMMKVKIKMKINIYMKMKIVMNTFLNLLSHLAPDLKNFKFLKVIKSLIVDLTQCLPNSKVQKRSKRPPKYAFKSILKMSKNKQICNGFITFMKNVGLIMSNVRKVCAQCYKCSIIIIDNSYVIL